MTQLQCQFSGERITLDTNTMVGGGGEGRIYGIVNDPSRVAKIYHKPTEEDADKLTVMYSMPPDAPMAAPGHSSIAWPLDLLRTLGKGQIVGFLMPRVNRVAPIHIFYTPKTRREQKPLFNYLYLHRTARNLAAAVNALHARGYVIGDVNESNILVTDTALVTLVDTDSFQVRDPYTQTVYRCPVGKPEFTPPELQGQTFREIDRTPEQDRFGLGVLIFQLLMEGTHPFSGVYQGNGEPPPIEVRIKSGHFPYGSRKVPYKPMPVAPYFDVLHPALQQLFIECFETGHRNPASRPDAKAWMNALKEAEDALITCGKNNQHRYGNHIETCPWCERTRRLKGRDPFPSKQAVDSGQHLQPLKPKRKQRVVVPQSAALAAQTTPANKLPPGKLTQRLGQYQPLITSVQRHPVLPPAKAKSRGRVITEDALLGSLWGVLLLSAVMGVILGTGKGGSAILGAIFVGAIWGGFFGMAWRLFMAPFASQLGALLVGTVWGAFLLSAIGGIIFGAIQQQPMMGQTVLVGGGLGLIWGTIWSLLKPPLTLPMPGRVWGTQGVFLGAIWGTFCGTIVVSVAAVVLAILPEFNGKISLVHELVSRLLSAIIPAAGLGAIGGISIGAVLGGVVGSPRLPLPMGFSGNAGGILGAIWGSFLGVMAGVGLGVMAAGLFPQVLITNNAASETAPILIGAVIVAAGFGAIWGIISGIVWGSMGKW